MRVKNHDGSTASGVADCIIDFICCNGCMASRIKVQVEMECAQINFLKIPNRKLRAEVFQLELYTLLQKV